ncbi:MAG: flagellar biosynthesis repressor FlbT [Erythrobacter sp.]
MNLSDDLPPTQELALEPGAQAVINGALISATSACTLHVGAGAFVLTGRRLWCQQNALRHPAEELYFSMLEAGTEPDRFATERYRFFSLLAQVVAQTKTRHGQKECAACAAAMMAEDTKSAIESAARLAADGLGDRAEQKAQFGSANDIGAPTKFDRFHMR